MRQCRETRIVDVLEYGLICPYVVLQFSGSDAVLGIDHIYTVGLLLRTEQETTSTRVWFLKTFKGFS